jgi:zinc protease
MKTSRLLPLLTCLLGSSVLVCAQAAANKTSFTVAYEKFTLENGLQVVFHLDRSDPVVAVSLTAHVGSARERPGMTGFAHLFEHLLFLESENLGKGGLDKLTARIGGSGANGSTSRDRTNYLQTVPKDALEKMLWAEADKLGWFINTVTDPVLAKEKQVVKNEKRQSVDNTPYGYTSELIDKALFPPDHPYHWQVIGSHADVQNATLGEVKEFFRRWYVPNNVTLVVAGDFDPAQAKQWVEKYFSEIKRGEAVTKQPKRPGMVSKTVSLYHEDNFATLPELTMAWPTVEQYHPDSYPLAVLAEYLSQGKKAPFYQVLVEEKKLAPDVHIGNQTSELAGSIELSVRAFASKDLDEVAAAVSEAFARFEQHGISEPDLRRILAGQETGFYNSLASVLGKGEQLAEYNIFANDPGFITSDIANILAVTPADVMRVYQKYIKNKNYVATSFVPKGQVALALAGSKMAEIAEEKIVDETGDAGDPTAEAKYERTPSSFDRSIEPPYGPAPEVRIPTIWKDKLANGMRVYGIQNNEVPLVRFEIVIEGGLLMEDIQQVGVANLMAGLMTQGTRQKTPLELEEAIQQLGATINVAAGTEDLRIHVNTLAANYKATLALVEEVLLEPRWDANEFELLKQSTLSEIRQQAADPDEIAQNDFNRLIYGNDNIRSRSILGTLESVNAITLDDLKAYYERNMSPSVTRMHVVGALDRAAVTSWLTGIDQRWKAKAVAIPLYQTPAPPASAQVYFHDVPGATQSVFMIGYPALAATDEDYFPATIMNYILGGGGFASRLTQQLREGKGYTYGIRSAFAGTKSPGPFAITTSVESGVTLEAAQLIKSILRDYPASFSDQDLATTKGFLLKSNARAFETAEAKLNMLGNISKFGWQQDYVKSRELIIKGITADEIKKLASKYLDPDKMSWLVVGDAKTQVPRLKALGFGEPISIVGQQAPNTDLTPQAIESRIQQHRTAEVTLTVLGADGKPLANTQVVIGQSRHKFLFGCNAFGVSPAETTDDQQAYQKQFAELLNFATLPYYWGAYEKVEGQPDQDRLRGMAQWCLDQGIRLKGHPLCWQQVSPAWLADKPMAEVENLQLGRITREVTAFRSAVETWDVVNEAVSMPSYNQEITRIPELARTLGTVELIRRTFAAARAANPKATLILNDYETSNKYEQLIADCLAAKVPIDVIGIQSHQHPGPWGAAKIWDVCQRFGRFGLPLHFTETTFISAEPKQNQRWSGPSYTDWPTTPEGEARQAREATEFYTILFSHPSVEAITWWDFSDKGCWLGAPAGLLRKDMSPKPAYAALLNLVKGKWWTAPQTLTTDAAGVVKFRGFLGTYSLATGQNRATFDVLTSGVANVGVSTR